MVYEQIRSYSFRYSGVMMDAMQSLPPGNGDIGANVWLSPGGDIHLLIPKTDSWSELYRLLKPAHIVLRETITGKADFFPEINTEFAIHDQSVIWQDNCAEVTLSPHSIVSIRMEFLPENF